MEAELNLCNLVSRGMTLQQAREKLGLTGENPLVAKPVEPTEPKEQKKLTPKEKKEALAAQIEAYGAEAPHMNSSVAKFEEALTAAKVAKAKKEQLEAEAAQKAADAAQKVADKEKAEAEDAAADLM